ncbi:hypothetical protein NQ317_000548 [Molorchus minor]|uniref:Myosin motor domain-containing protein n=1 Tax=Molorchus minor TaxID=1323400 RepID=A0ABQ9JSL2_9CUCU|nr:hypothetical protein NQ317_000548 [Molorchus minor]
MLQMASTFENSLRGRDVPSPFPRKKPQNHTSCKGLVHGTGNYSPTTDVDKSPFQRGSSGRWSRKSLGSARKTQDAGDGDKKPTSVSSENCSESDSLESVGEKTKSSETTEPAKKSDNICARLFKSVTKASMAKTAKMRHLDIFDVDENSWIGGLRKASTEDIDKSKPTGDKVPQESGLNRSRNGSMRKKGGDENGKDVGVSRGRNGSGKQSGEDFARSSFRRKSLIRKGWSKVKCVKYDEILFASENRRANGFFGSVNGVNCFKDLNEMIEEAKSEEHLAEEKQWLETEKLWLMHRGGFAAARRETVENQEPGKLKIRLDATGDILCIDEDDIEKANPPQFDRAEDLASLRHLNESSVLHTLRQRYATNLIHTYAGSGTLLVVNPMAPLAIYSEKVVSLFKGCKSEDMPPHIYSMAQSSYHAMLSTRRDQSMVFLGRSGSGKTTNFRHCVQYLVTAAGASGKVLTLEKLTALWTVLESFGNCKTVMNTNATRFTQIFSLDFDQSGVVASASVQAFMLEKTRIARKIENETTFHIMQRLLSGVEGNLRKELHLENLSGNENNPFMGLLQRHEDRQRAQLDFVKVCSAMNILGFADTEQRLIFSVLAAIFHLGCAGAVKGKCRLYDAEYAAPKESLTVFSIAAGSSNRYQFANPQSAQKAASLLGTTAEELSRVMFGLASGGMPTPNATRQPFRTPSPTEKGLDREAVGLEAVEGFVIGLYAEVFNCVVSLVNRSISAPNHTVTSILLIDAPGFQNPATCGRQAGASFEDLCHNYLQERLQLLFHHTNLVAPRDRYLQENVDFAYAENENDNLINPMPLVNLLDKQAQNTMIRTSQGDLHEADRRGLLWLLDEEAIYPGSSDDSFLERLFTHYGERDHQLLLRKAPGNQQFILQHLQGTNPVLYSAKGWLKCSRENPVARAAAGILQESCKEEMSKLFVSTRGLGASSFSGSLVGIEGSQSLRRASSIRRTFTVGTAAIKRKSICLQTKFTIDGLVETMRRTKLRFVQCILPQHNAGLCETNASLLAVKTTSAGQAEDSLINVPLLRSQIRGGQILDSVRLYKQGFPHFLPLGEFRETLPTPGRRSQGVQSGVGRTKGDRGHAARPRSGAVQL